MTPSEYFQRFVLPAFNDYCEAEAALTAAAARLVDSSREESDAIRKAANSAIATWHMADWMWEHFASSDRALLYNAPDLASYRRLLEGNYCEHLRTNRPSEDFNLLGAIADAFKHYKIRNNARQIAGADAIAGISTGWGQLAWGEGKWGGGAQVLVQLRDGTQRAYSSVIQNCVDMWRRSLGLVPLPPVGR
jgi:hypothetical protein